MSKQIHNMVTEKVIHAIEDAIRTGSSAPWQKPWFQNGVPTNLVSKKPYRGINVFLLSMLGYVNSYFLSFKQVQELGGSVKKGEKAIPVIFWKQMLVTEDENGNKLDKPKSIPLLRYYNVFNVEQTQGINPKKIPEVQRRKFNPIQDAEKIVANMPNKPEIKHEQAQAYYMPSFDYINMPKHEFFKSDSEYYSTLFHELVHSTGHESRLNRKEVSKTANFGSHDYSVEELVAEMGAVFLCNEIGIETTFDNSVAYLKSWLGKLKDDTTMLITASARAQKAVDYITDRMYKETEKETE
jgi:antirestriction protein ArdC